MEGILAFDDQNHNGKYDITSVGDSWIYEPVYFQKPDGSNIPLKPDEQIQVLQDRFKPMQLIYCGWSDINGDMCYLSEKQRDANIK